MYHYCDYGKSGGITAMMNCPECGH
ncbi:levansucrase regulator, partial [Salmonella enterica]|nr:levansucrase regulator [Salmonella enterica]EAS0073421.1 levansucrase regulator [Salmonella enterica]EBM6371286.1 levansucrase regulator [Salmonella enterica]EBM6371297.1 levansucrase regulator [Salmonella enterica]EGZ6933845.1 levansucrase regulator [Salmonella enterica]